MERDNECEALIAFLRRSLYRRFLSSVVDNGDVTIVLTGTELLLSQISIIILKWKVGLQLPFPYQRTCCRFTELRRQRPLPGFVQPTSFYYPSLPVLQMRTQVCREQGLRVKGLCRFARDQEVKSVYPNYQSLSGTVPFASLIHVMMYLGLCPSTKPFTHKNTRSIFFFLFFVQFLNFF